MRRKRHGGDTKVWHDPVMTPAGRRKQNGASPQPADDGDGSARRRKRKPKREGARIVAGPAPQGDPAELERERLLSRLLYAEGRPSISQAADDYVAAGFELPDQQAIWLQLLEHRDEGRVQTAIERLTALLDEQAPERRAVLESRLRRIEDLADEVTTQHAAAALRRMLAAKHAATLA